MTVFYNTSFISDSREIRFQEHRFAVRREITLKIFHSNVYTLSSELRPGSKDECIWKNEKASVRPGFSSEAISLKLKQ